MRCSEGGCDFNVGGVRGSSNSGIFQGIRGNDGKEIEIVQFPYSYISLRDSLVTPQEGKHPPWPRHELVRAGSTKSSAKYGGTDPVVVQTDRK